MIFGHQDIFNVFDTEKKIQMLESGADARALKIAKS